MRDDSSQQREVTFDYFRQLRNALRKRLLRQRRTNRIDFEICLDFIALALWPLIKP